MSNKTMGRRARVAGLVPVALVVAGCASIPDATLTYYPAKSVVTVKVVRSVACTADNMPLVVSSVVPAVVHAADTGRPETFKLASLRGDFTDTDAKFEFFEDGRLKAVNAVSQGQGETVVKAALSLATSVLAMGVVEGADYGKECGYINKNAGDRKPLTVTYQADVELPKDGTYRVLSADAASQAYAQELARVLGPVCAQFTPPAQARPPRVAYTRKADDVVLKLQQPAWVALDVGAPLGGDKCSASLWTGEVLVAQLGRSYELPVPKALLFGKQGFGLALSDAGTLLSVQYTSTSGVAGGLTAASAVLGFDTTAAEAAAKKAEADLIAQQQRLLVCKATPKDCPK